MYPSVVLSALWSICPFTEVGLVPPLALLVWYWCGVGPSVRSSGPSKEICVRGRRDLDLGIYCASRGNLTWEAECKATRLSQISLRISVSVPSLYHQCHHTPLSMYTRLYRLWKDSKFIYPQKIVCLFDFILRFLHLLLLQWKRPWED